MSCGPGMSPLIERKRFLQASEGVNTCLPDDSGAQSISSGLLTTCTTAAQAASVFALQVWKAICYLFGLIQTTQSDITTLQDDITTLQQEIAAITPMRTPGAITILEGPGAGAGATVTVDGNDTAGQITLNTGTGTGTGVLFTITNSTPFTTAGILHLEAANGIGNPLPFTLADVNGATASYVGGIGDANTFIFNYVILGGT